MENRCVFDFQFVHHFEPVAHTMHEKLIIDLRNTTEYRIWYSTHDGKNGKDIILKPKNMNWILRK